MVVVGAQGGSVNSRRCISDYDGMESRIGDSDGIALVVMLS